MSEPTDVLVLGGGLAGLTLALQIHRARPQTRITVVDKAAWPPPVAAHKVGESTVELGTHYLREVLGLADYLDTSQLPKLGLRFFFDPGQPDIARRLEMGASGKLPVPSHQLDRGLFEAELARRARDAGIEHLTGWRVSTIELDKAGHTTRIKASGETRTIASRWVVDATGRSATLKRKLGLLEPLDHHANAVWFRVDSVVDVDDWSTDPAWRGRIPAGLRRLSTNHLMGPGYWVWLIPLSNTTASIGVVGTPAFFRTLPTDDAACLHHVMAGVPGIFRRLRLDRFLYGPGSFEDYSGAVGQLHGPGYVLVGSALGFTDPMFSTGVTVALESAALAAPQVANALRGESVDWDEQYGAPLMQGINVVRTFVNGWYDGTLPEVFFGKNWHPSFRRQLTSVLSGHLWDETNPFVRRADRSVPGLPDP